VLAGLAALAALAVVGQVFAAANLLAALLAARSSPAGLLGTE
jgi:hypothetical protein